MVVIVGGDADVIAPRNGAWEYSLDGTNWLLFNAPLTSGHALLLADDDNIRFVPNSQNGTAASLSFYAWDRSNGLVAGTYADVSTRGNTTAYSAAGGSTSISVSSVNDAPRSPSITNDSPQTPRSVTAIRHSPNGDS